jgi:hypothetical protein
MIGKNGWPSTKTARLAPTVTVLAEAGADPNRASEADDSANVTARWRRERIMPNGTKGAAEKTTRAASNALETAS